MITSIDDIYASNEKCRRDLLAAVDAVADDKASQRPETGWSVSEIAEHVMMVSEAAVKICGRLTAAAVAAGKPSDGSFAVSEVIAQNFQQAATAKLEAPSMVHPSGSLSIAEIKERLTRASSDLEGLRANMKSFDLSDSKFPHPYFGPMNAAEWLLVAGFHEGRHARQIAQLSEAL